MSRDVRISPIVTLAHSFLEHSGLDYVPVALLTASASTRDGDWASVCAPPPEPSCWQEWQHHARGKLKNESQLELFRVPFRLSFDHHFVRQARPFSNDCDGLVRIFANLQLIPETTERWADMPIFDRFERIMTVRHVAEEDMDGRPTTLCVTRKDCPWVSGVRPSVRLRGHIDHLKSRVEMWDSSPVGVPLFAHNPYTGDLLYDTEMGHSVASSRFYTLARNFRTFTMLATVWLAGATGLRPPGRAIYTYSTVPCLPWCDRPGALLAVGRKDWEELNVVDEIARSLGMTAYFV